MSANDSLGLVLGGERKDDKPFDASSFGKNALRIALNIPTSSGLQIPTGG